MKLNFDIFPYYGSHSDIGKYRFHAKYVAKKFSRNLVLVSECIFKIAADQRHNIYGRERNCLKTLEQVTRVVYLRVALSRMYERDPITEKKFGTEIQMRH